MDQSPDPFLRGFRAKPQAIDRADGGSCGKEKAVQYDIQKGAASIQCYDKQNR
jgi:hypothetical protein